MRRMLAALSVVAGVVALGAGPAQADPRISIVEDHGCYYLMIEAKSFPLFCLTTP